MASLNKTLPPILLGIAAFVVALFPVSDADIFWHLRTGNDILASGALPIVDTYSVSSFGKPWTDGHVLFQIAVAALYWAGGLLAIVLAKALLIGLSAALVGWKLSRRGPNGLGVIWASALVALSRPLLLERPVILSVSFIVLSLLVLEHYVKSHRWQWLPTLPVLCGLWTWCQPLWPLGPALVLAYGMGQLFSRDGLTARCLLCTFAACCLACLASPYGIRGLSLPFVHLLRIGEIDTSVFSTNISENLPLPALIASGDATLVAVPTVFALSIGISLVKPSRIPWSRLAVLVGFFCLALLANRNALLFYWSAAILIGLQIRDLCEGHSFAAPRLSGAAQLLSASAVIAWSLTAFPSLAQLRDPRPFLTPQTSLPLIEQLPADAKVFTSVRYGSYLLLVAAPRVRPYIDGRLVLRTADEFAEYLRSVDTPSTFPRLDERFRFDAVLLPVAGPERYQPLVASLSAHPDWVMTHTDGIEVLFERRNAGKASLILDDAQTVARLEASLAARFEGHEDERNEALARLGWLLSLIGLQERACAVLGQIDTPKAAGLLAASHYRAGDIGAAQRTALRLLERHDEDINALVVLATIALNEDNFDKAKQIIRRAAQVAPHDGRVEALARKAASAAP